MSSDDKRLFGRSWRVRVGPKGSPGTLGAIEAATGFDVSNLRCVFKVKKSLKLTPNTCELKVYNLAESSRRVLEAATKLVVAIEVGYVETGTSQIYLGEVRQAFTTWEGPDCITTMTSGDSEQEIQTARLHVPVGPGVPPDVVLGQIARALKVGEGNLAQATALLASKGVAQMFGRGTVISGNAAQELRDLCRSAGLECSVQDGVLQILDLNKPLQDKAVELATGTGLVGSPAIDFSAPSKTNRGGAVVKARAFLIPELAPGRKVLFASRDIKGGHRIEEVEYDGDTHGSDWYANLVCRSY